MRHFVKLSYKGTNYFGWQRQPNQISVQGTLEKAFSTILNTDIAITGCGRTDTGVHAKDYILHFDFEGELPNAFLNRINKFLPKDIAIHNIFEVEKEKHARFDAIERSYEYHVIFEKNPFKIETAYHFPYPNSPDKEKMQRAAQLLLNYTEFAPFCKSKSDVKTMKCDLKRSEWILFEDENRMIYEVTANRFLRGMIRLIVGMCLNVGMGKLDLKSVQKAMENQTLLEKSWSVPPQGLFLKGIKY